MSLRDKFLNWLFSIPVIWWAWKRSYGYLWHLEYPLNFTWGPGHDADWAKNPVVYYVGKEE